MNYLTPFAILILVLSPVLLPAIITGAHAIAEWRRKPAPVRPVITPERRAADLVYT